MKERPTTDRAKEGLFNILQNRFDLDQLKVLDLFAGSGSISFEFCSQGNPQVTALERDRKLSSFIIRTAMELGMDRLNVENDDALRFLDHCPASYDLIFADPPYAEETLYHEVLDRIERRKLLKKGGVLILEHDEHLELGGRKGYQETRRFGNSRFSFFVL